MDFTETFSPVVRYTTISVFLALCALLSLHVNQTVADYAYVNADLKDGTEIWCVPLPGMNVLGGSISC